MGYQVTYREDGWQRAIDRPGDQQVVIQNLGGGRYLVVDLTVGASGAARVVSAVIEQSYVTRRQGRKQRIIERLDWHEIELAEASSHPIMTANAPARSAPQEETPRRASRRRSTGRLRLGQR
jgi:hypothetical protein